MFYQRDLQKVLLRYAKFPVIALLGPRQSGKTTLARHGFKDHKFISFEDPMVREFATSDPRKFLEDIENDQGVILDEFQYVSQILSYIQLEVDAKKRPGYFVLTGSQNFLMNQAITQSLAGRVGILTLLPLSINEMQHNEILPQGIDAALFNGAYARIYAEGVAPADFYSSYINTYLERDVRLLSNVGDLRIFQKFLALCAGRIGQQLNLSDIATNCGISVPTATKWLSVLEASYVIFVLQPYFNNFNKRLTKTSKLFFYDTGLACNLLGISSAQALSLSPFRGNLFESMIISDLYKQYCNSGARPALYFWRDQNGRIEVDCIVDRANSLLAVEIKSSSTISSAFFDNLVAWNEISQTTTENNYLIYAGGEKQSRSKGNIIGWKSIGDFISKHQT